MLAYLFKAWFVDGTIITQTHDDVSTIDPTRSAFYDVVQAGLDNLTSFGLYSAFGLYSDTRIHFVSLQDGHFEINGIPFRVEGKQQLPPDTTYRLIYFRRHTHEFTSDRIELSHSIEYVFGWQATVDGKNHQHTVVIT